MCLCVSVCVCNYLDPVRYGYPVKHPLAEQFGMTLLQPLRRTDSNWSPPQLQLSESVRLVLWRSSLERYKGRNRNTNSMLPSLCLEGTPPCSHSSCPRMRKHETLPLPPHHSSTRATGCRPSASGVPLLSCSPVLGLFQKKTNGKRGPI